ncbi:MAG: oxidoreductase [Planctomycetota bacterium]
MLHQFLSPVYNRRKDRYGGSPAGRATLLFEIREQIAKTCGAGFPVLLKFCAQELGARGRHLTLEQGIGLAQGAQEAGFDALTPVAASVLPDTALCRGQFPKKSFGNSALQAKLREATGSRLRSGALKLNMRIAAWRFPYRPVWNRPVFGAVKRAVSIPVFAVGGIRTPAEANQILTSGEADLIGVGRPFYAEPALAARWLAAADDCHEPTACANCNQCVVPQMLGLPGACYSPTTQKRARALESRDD